MGYLHAILQVSFVVLCHASKDWFSGEKERDYRQCQNLRDKSFLQKKSVWLDVDTGNDDSMGIISALFNNNLKVVGLSTTFGNTILEFATVNTVKMLSTLGFLEVPVIRGAYQPLIKDHTHKDLVHGSLGMYGAEELNELFQPILDDHQGIKSIYEFLRNHTLTQKQKTSFIVLGPHTNTARLLTQYPDVSDYISEIIFMGGCTGEGNVSPYSEFNAWIDAEALEIVFKETQRLNIPLTMVPLDLTEQARIELHHISSIRQMPGNFTQWVASLIEKLREVTLAYVHPCPTLHDAVAITYVSHPELFKTKLMNIQIKTDQIRYGQTQVQVKGEPNTIVVTEIDIAGFWSSFFKSVRQATGRAH